MHRSDHRFALGCVGLLLSLGGLGQSSSAAEKQRQVWVTNSAGNDVHVFDVATLELVRRIEVGPNPHGISATADGKTVHIALEHFRKERGELLWLDTATGKITDRLT